MRGRESLDELAARAALRPRTGRVLHLGPIRERTSDAEQARPSGVASETNGGSLGMGGAIPPASAERPVTSPEATA